MSGIFLLNFHKGLWIGFFKAYNKFTKYVYLFNSYVLNMYVIRPA